MDAACPTCHQPISAADERCPQCGRRLPPLRTGREALFWIVFLAFDVIVLLALAWAGAL